MRSQAGDRAYLPRGLHALSFLWRFPLEQFISQADEAMERFLEGLYFDRI